MSSTFRAIDENKSNLQVGLNEKREQKMTMYVTILNGTNPGDEVMI